MTVNTNENDGCEGGFNVFGYFAPGLARHGDAVLADEMWGRPHCWT